VANVLKTGSDWLVDELKEHASTEVTIRRLGFATDNVKAVIGATNFDREDSGGLIQTHQTRDFFILAADYVLDGEAVRPERGDRIEETQDGTTYHYEVMDDLGVSHEGFADNFRKQLQIHTKRVG